MEEDKHEQYNICGEHIRSVIDRQSHVSVDACLVRVLEKSKPLEGHFIPQRKQDIKFAGNEMF